MTTTPGTRPAPGGIAKYTGISPRRIGIRMLGNGDTSCLAAVLPVGFPDSTPSDQRFGAGTFTEIDERRGADLFLPGNRNTSSMRRMITTSTSRTNALLWCN